MSLQRGLGGVADHRLTLLSAEMFEVEGSRERRIVIGYRMETTTSYFSALSDLYHFYGLFSSRKYVEQFR